MIDADIISRLVDGRHYLFISRYSLSADGESWDAAYRKLVELHRVRSALAKQGRFAYALTGNNHVHRLPDPRGGLCGLAIDIVRSFLKLVAVIILSVATLLLLPHMVGRNWLNLSRATAVQLAPITHEFWRLAPPQSPLPPPNTGTSCSRNESLR